MKCLLAQNKVCWDTIIDISIFHCILPIIYDALNKLDWHKIPRETIARFQKLWRERLARNVILFTEFDRLAASFSEKGIAAIPLKGPFWAKLLYPNENLRSFNDFDFLIKPEDIKPASDLLNALNYQPAGPTDIDSQPENSRNIPFYKQLPGSKRVMLELHWRLGYSKDYTFPLKQWWRNARKIEANGIEYPSFSLEDTLHYMTVNMHASRYMYLKLFVDLRQFLIHNKGALDWQYIEKSIKRIGHWNNFCYAVSMTDRLFPNSNLTHSVPMQLKRSQKTRVLQTILGRREILQGTYGGDARYLFLMLVINDRTGAILKRLIRNIFPSFAAVASRHSVRQNSPAQYLLYILTPFYSIFRLFSRYGADFIAKPNN